MNGTSDSPRRRRSLGPVVATSVAFAIEAFLIKVGGRYAVTMDDFIHDYVRLFQSQGKTPSGHPLVVLPRRGDLVRMVTRFPGLVRFDRETHELTLASSSR